MNNHHERIKKLREMALSGEITYSDTKKKLTVAIEKEYQSEQPNINFINACEDMLWEIDTQDHQHFVSANERYLEVVHQNAKPHKERSFPRILVKRIAIVFTVMSVILCICGGSFHGYWFFSGISPDNEQYVIHGQSIDISLITHCIAEHNNEDIIQTEDWNAFVAFLGFEPQIINPIALESSSVQYYAYIEDDRLYINARYTVNNGENSITFSMRCYSNNSDAYFATEQDTFGENQSVDSCIVYTNVNQNRCSLTWIDGITVYHISGDFGIEDGLSLVRNYIRGLVRD